MRHTRQCKPAYEELSAQANDSVSCYHPTWGTFHWMSDSNLIMIDYSWRRFCFYFYFYFYLIMGCVSSVTRDGNWCKPLDSYWLLVLLSVIEMVVLQTPVFHGIFFKKKKMSTWAEQLPEHTVFIDRHDRNNGVTFFFFFSFSYPNENFFFPIICT